MFGQKKLTPKEQLRETKREIRHNERDMDRELQNLAREEAKLIHDIKKMAANNQHGPLKVMAKSLVQLRAQKDKLITMKTTMTGVGYKASLMHSQAAVGQAMGRMTGVMGDMNEMMDATKTSKVMTEFARQNEYMNVKEDLLDDALMDAFDGDGVEEEAESVVNQVLEEIGLELGSKMADVPVGKLRDAVDKESIEDKAALEALHKVLPSLP